MRIDLTIATGPIAALSNESAIDPQATDRTVLLVPGYTGSKEDFMPLLRPLADAGYHAVAIDQRGQYESAWAASEQGYRIPALAGDVLDISEAIAIGDRALHLVGHSFGGLVTRAAVLAKPGLFASFTLMDSGPGAISGLRLAAMQAGEPVLRDHGLAALWDQIALSSQADSKFRQSPPALLDFLRRRFMANDPVGLQAMGEELRTVEDLTEELSRVDLPMLVLNGVDDDAWSPAVQAEMAARLGARHTLIPDAAHSPAVENPGATVSALLDFWGGLPERSPSGRP
ncbi:MAG: hypothetical protein QOH56_3979 [Pseudonocardiales bacterium]|nr:hypothetical protein [Pseudonocardiales bacterium]